MIWWATQPKRGRQEKAAIGDLEASADWLNSVSWRFDNALTLTVDFEIVFGDRSEPCTLRYPEFFPDTLPSITPHSTERLSQHQYGAGGELCLEYRADNWSPDVTGAMLIESAYRLLSTEADATAGPVPNAHRTTLGQDLRGARLRMPIAESLASTLRELPPGTIVQGKLEEHRYAGSWIAIPFSLGEGERTIWEEPALRVGSIEHQFSAVRVEALDGFSELSELEQLRAWLKARGHPNWTEQYSDVSNAFLIVSDGREIQCLLVWGEPTDRGTLYYKVVPLPAPSSRLAPEFASVRNLQVGIVGCGSVGSKVAVSLARTGIGKFLLIDPDILFPENLVRNDLDWRAVGLNKARSVKQRIHEINPSALVTCREILLGGQESAGSTASALSALGECDLIIDSSGSPYVFNLCAAVSRANSKPIVWALVFAGGIGGLVARARPNIDPIPLAVRNQIRLWYVQRGIPWDIEEQADYAGIEVDGTPLIASDADVSVIASHMTRFVLDTLIAPDASAFPFSAYAIGLSDKWIFPQPFVTFPIEYTIEGSWGAEDIESRAEEISAFLREILPQVNEGNDAD